MTFREKLRPKTSGVISIFCVKLQILKKNGEILKKYFLKKH